MPTCPTQVCCQPAGEPSGHLGHGSGKGAMPLEEGTGIGGSLAAGRRWSVFTLLQGLIAEFLARLQVRLTAGKSALHFPPR